MTVIRPRWQVALMGYVRFALVSAALTWVVALAGTGLFAGGLQGMMVSIMLGGYLTWGFALRLAGSMLLVGAPIWFAVRVLMQKLGTTRRQAGVIAAAVLALVTGAVAVILIGLLCCDDPRLVSEGYVVVFPFITVPALIVAPLAAWWMDV